MEGADVHGGLEGQAEELVGDDYEGAVAELGPCGRGLGGLHFVAEREAGEEKRDGKVDC